MGCITDQGNPAPRHPFGRRPEVHGSGQECLFRRPVQQGGDGLVPGSESIQKKAAMIHDPLPSAFFQPDQRAPVSTPSGRWSGQELQAASHAQPHAVDKSGAQTPRHALNPEYLGASSSGAIDWRTADRMPSAPTTRSASMKLRPPAGEPGYSPFAATPVHRAPRTTGMSFIASSRTFWRSDRRIMRLVFSTCRSTAPSSGADDTFVLPVATGHDSVLQVDAGQGGQGVGPRGIARHRSQ